MSGSKKSYSTAEYPSVWSEWEWGIETECYSRFRLTSRGNFEFAYSESKNEVGPTSVTPSTSQIPTASEESGNHSSHDAHLASDSYLPPPEAHITQEPALQSVIRSRSSSESSERSLSSSNAGPSGGPSSIASSVPHTHRDHDRLANFLQKDRPLQSLIRQLFVKFGPESAETKLRCSLVIFADNIKLEAKSSFSVSMIEAGKMIQHLARPTASTIKTAFENGTFFLNHSRYEKTFPVMIAQERISPNMGSDLLREDSSGDDEDDSNDREKNEPGAYQVLPSLETDLLSCLAYNLLIEGLRLQVRSDKIRKLLSRVWPPLHEQTALLRFDYSVEWEVPSFIKNYFPAGTRLGNILTVSGDAVDAQAQTCGEYLLANWPGIGALLLTVLEDFLDSGGQVGNRNEVAEIAVTAKTTFAPTTIHSQLNVSVIAAQTTHAEVLTAMGWVCSAVRYFEGRGVALSSTAITLPKGPDVTCTFELRPEILTPVTTANSCWHSLFSHGSIAEGYPIAARSAGTGLEISFGHMALASMCLSVVEYDRGLIAHGLTSILIPMTEIKEDGAIQWHFEDKTKQKGHSLARVSQVLRGPEFKYWYRELSLNRLSNRRAFLGWTDDAVVVLGTKDYELSLESSGATVVSPTRSTYPTTGTLGTGGLGFFTAEIAVSRRQVTGPNSLTAAQRNDIFDALRTGKDDKVLIVDNKEKISWYLPYASVVLQMTHSYIKNRGYQLYLDDKPVPASLTSIFAEPCPDGASEARRALEELLKFKIIKGESAKGACEEYVQDLIESHWHRLENIGLGLDNPTFHNHVKNFVAPKYIHGIELVDALDNTYSAKIKRVRVDQPWAFLTVEDPIVLLSTNVQPPIEARSANLCHSWTSIPRAQNYMAAMGFTVNSFLNSSGAAGLSNKLDWDRNTQLIKQHGEVQGLAVHHSQKLVCRNKLFPDTVPCSVALKGTIQEHAHSCFVFGNGSEDWCSQPIHNSKLPISGHQNGSSLPTALNQFPEDTESIPSDFDSRRRIWKAIQAILTLISCR